MKPADAGGQEDLSRRLRELPAVDRVAKALVGTAPEATRTAIARRAIDEERDRIRQGGQASSFEKVVARGEELVRAGGRGLLQPVINATGVLIHTNLGRVPLGARQLDAVRTVSESYSNLEYDIDTGRRGSRYSHARSLLGAITGAESALVVNNNAAAVLVTLAALCAHREVIVSRGELIEIGGEFRVPDVMAASGARMVEVGTTNRTHIADYERAISGDTAAILKVHPSNYRLVGFTAAVEAGDLARLARGRKVPFLHDLGSGFVSAPPGAPWAEQEPSVRATVVEGADIVTFSGDKLLGGPQAGIIAGRGPLIDKISKHPLLRAVRVDKMTLAALEVTLTMYLEGDSDQLPLWQMATFSLEALESRARTLAVQVPRRGGLAAEAVPCRSVTGGGSLPGTEIDSWAIALSDSGRSAAELERILRRGSPPVIARIEDDRLLLDLRTVSPTQDGAFRTIFGQLGNP
jgi:L-seryl-tRNA(Ser) seleniumtransferase